MNRKLLFVNADCEYECTEESVTAGAGAADAGKFITLDANGMIDPTLLPDLTEMFTVGTGGVTAGLPVCIEADDTVGTTDIMTPCRVIGIAATTEAAAGTVSVLPNDACAQGVITGATAGDVYYYDGTALTTTKPTAPGSRVWQVGVAKNATDLYTDIRFIKVNS